jgi:hypothetical protein
VADRHPEQAVKEPRRKTFHRLPLLQTVIFT